MTTYENRLARVEEALTMVCTSQVDIDAKLISLHSSLEVLKQLSDEVRTSSGRPPILWPTLMMQMAEKLASEAESSKRLREHLALKASASGTPLSMSTFAQASADGSIADNEAIPTFR